MGFHHVYDNANISDCKWMIDEITSHMNWLFSDLYAKQWRNVDRRARRRKNIKMGTNDTVSDDESYGSDAEHRDESMGEDYDGEDEDDEEEEPSESEKYEEGDDLTPGNIEKWLVAQKAQKKKPAEKDTQ